MRPEEDPHSADGARRACPPSTCEPRRSARDARRTSAIVATYGVARSGPKPPLSTSPSHSSAANLGRWLPERNPLANLSRLTAGRVGEGGIKRCEPSHLCASLAKGKQTLRERTIQDLIALVPRGTSHRSEPRLAT